MRQNWAVKLAAASAAIRTRPGRSDRSDPCRYHRMAVPDFSIKMLKTAQFDSVSAIWGHSERAAFGGLNRIL